jgi:dihydroorotase
MDIIKILLPDDFHVHFRRGKMLEAVVPHTVRHFGRAMVMPNTTPKPILIAEDALEYRREIKRRIDAMNMEWDFFDYFQALMTIQITDETTPEMVREAKKHDFVIAGKVYPKGVTTNSHNGVSDFTKLYQVFAAMQEVGMVLSLHGQVPKSFCLDREKDFLPILIKLAKDFPRLRIVMEHISTKESVEVVKHLPHTVAATITAHHLVLTLHDVLSYVGEDGSEGLNPHHYCQPILQQPEDQSALIGAAISGNPKFFFGSDSAPHLRERKESSCGCAGVFTAPVILPVLAEFFSSFQEFGQPMIQAFEQFVSIFGAQFYGLPLNDGEITLVKEPWIVPNDYDGIVPFWAGKQLKWKVQ